MHLPLRLLPAAIGRHSLRRGRRSRWACLLLFQRCSSCRHMERRIRIPLPTKRCASCMSLAWSASQMALQQRCFAAVTTSRATSTQRAANSFGNNTVSACCTLRQDAPSSYSCSEHEHVCQNKREPAGAWSYSDRCTFAC